MPRLPIWSLLMLALLGGASLAAPTQRRVALVIGNAEYKFASPLDNPANDAQAMARALRGLDFDVTLALNVDKAAFEQRIRDFANSLTGANAAVFFYAGHGLQVDGRNYMVPVDAQVADEADLPFALVAVDIVLHRLAHHRITNIVFLDACRDNPLGEKLAGALGARSKAVGQGLASLHAGVGTLISFSTQPGNVALDGDGKNSPFARALLDHISTPNIDVLGMLKRVRRDVFERTNQSQVPWDNSSLIDEFFFHTVVARERQPPSLQPLPQPQPDPKPQPPARDHDLSLVLPPENNTRPVLTGRPPAHPCDSIAASATDPERIAPGTTFGDLDGTAGVRACRAALAKYPNTPRFEFQLARSLHQSKQYDEAASLYRSLVERGYLAALTNYGWLLNFGQGVAQNQVAATRLHLLAAHQGDTFGMFNAAMAYDSGSGLPYNPAQAAHWIYAALRLGHEYSIRQMSGDAAGWTRDFRVELQRLLRRAGVYAGPADGAFGPDLWQAIRQVQTLPFAPNPGGNVPTHRFDPKSIPVNAPPPR
ncbi:MAG: caspase family protein [Proteobacteria bacterium]|nr:caspase family protein [Pseudomonadota bacterium]